MTGSLDLVSYRKPAALCRQGGASEDVEPELAARLVEIEGRLGSLGLELRVAGADDWERLDAFFRARLAPVSAAALGPYDLYRVLLFGRSLLLEDSDRRVMGYFLEQSYRDAARTSFCVSLAVAASLAGRRLAADLVTWAGALARSAGARVQRAIVSPLNLASCVTFFNHVGHIAEGFEPDLKGYGEPRFQICCPLDGAGLWTNRVDLERVRRLLAEGPEAISFELLRWDDLAGLDRAFAERGLRVVAALPAGVAGAEPHYLAVPEARLAVVRV